MIVRASCESRTKRMKVLLQLLALQHSVLGLAANPASLSHSTASARRLYVDCSPDRSAADAAGTATEPLASVAAARDAIRLSRLAQKAPFSPMTVMITGLCELPSSLTLDRPADSHVAYVGAGPGAILSGGTKLDVPADAVDAGTNAADSAPITLDLSTYGFSAANLGRLRGKGYTGGNACIVTNNYIPTAAELTYRPGGAASVAGAAAYGPGEIGTMRLARYPNVQAAVPSKTDWAKLSKVDNHTLSIAGVDAVRAKRWAADLAVPGAEGWMHGLWSWNCEF